MERASRAGRLILVRHGESHWNVKGGTKFTGWADIPMTDLGKKQAVACGKLLASIPGLSFDAVFTSLLRRATLTYELIAANMPHAHACKNVRVSQSWRLNERHYGALVGLSKTDAEKQLGKEKVMGWRRSWDLRPPPMIDPKDNILADPTSESPLYDWQSEIWTNAITMVRRPVMRGSEFVMITEKTVDKNAMMPKAESLKDCAERVLPLWKEDILPRLVYGQTVLIVGHSNTIRGMVKFMDNISDENITSVVIPSAIPLIYSFEIDPNNSALIKPMGEKSSIGMTGRFVITKELIELSLAADQNLEMSENLDDHEEFKNSLRASWDTLDREEKNKLKARKTIRASEQIENIIRSQRDLANTKDDILTTQRQQSADIGETAVMDSDWMTIKVES